MRKGSVGAVRLGSLDGETLQAALVTAAQWLERRAEAINALNVFPVPDGDTGLNMSLTLASAAREAGTVEGASVGPVAKAMARGALLGSRGNSGVILAKLLGGVAEEIATCQLLDARNLTLALRAGAKAAYEALANPVEGTILTVARAAAAGAAAVSSGDIIEVLEAAHRSAQVAVAETPDLLPVLKQASVVDAGGEGFRILLEGLLFHLRGDTLPEGASGPATWADLSSVHQGDGDFYGYCTEILIQGRGLDAAAIRQQVSALGSSVLVVGDGELIKLHVHTPRPGAILDFATDLGELLKVKIDNMQIQHEEFAARASTSGLASREPALKREPGTSLVAVTSGNGVARVFESLGVTVVDGGSTMNPSVEDIGRAIEAARRSDVLVLPNNPNVILAAEEAARLVPDRAVRVIPTRNVAQGVAAALALSPEADAAANVAGCCAASARTHCIEMTRAARSATLGGIDIGEGQCFGLLDGEPAAADRGFRAVLDRSLQKLSTNTLEIATVYVGADGTAEEADDLKQCLEENRGVEVEIVSGGQPNYPYIISLE